MGSTRTSKRSALSLADYENGVITNRRAVLAQAITLVESQRTEDQDLAQELLRRILPRTGGAHRVGITGVPGVGKSTFIEKFGDYLVNRGYRVAVLAVDPSSTVSGGSILGDKSRMATLAQAPEAFIRPSPSARSLGGVARRTRESLLLCEAAGYDVVLVETVGVGQSETVVADMVDFFCVLMLPGAGDELQGIKKGIIELADLIAINKADGDTRPLALAARADYAAALRYLRPKHPAWKPRAITVSALTGEGVDKVWSLIQEHRHAMRDSGALEETRREQMRKWLWNQIEERLLSTFRSHPHVVQALAAVEHQVMQGQLPPTQGARELLAAFGIEGVS